LTLVDFNCYVIHNTIMPKSYDAIVIGSGPNGLAAAITLAQAGLSVVVFEAKETIGGGMRSAELTLPGFIHDICSAVHPLGIGSPFFKSLPLDQYGLEWIQPSVPLAHPFDDGSAVILYRSIDSTSDMLGSDGIAYKKLMAPLVDNWNNLADEILGPLHFPKHPLLMAQFAILAIRSANSLSKSRFQGERARSFFLGLAAHSIMPLTQPLTAAFGLILGALGHAEGWPIPKGGSQKIADALALYFLSLGGKICTGRYIDNVDKLPSSKVILCDISPRQLLQIAGDRLPSRYKGNLERFRYGPGVFKIDWALNAPIPWKATECARAGTVHLGTTSEEILASESAIWKNCIPDKPYVLIAQPSLFDSTRAPKGKHTAWGYCHVSNGSTIDMTTKIEAQIERCAPGFRDCIIARSTKSAKEMEQYNPNYVGGDINGGVQDITQLYTRPTARVVPYSTPIKGLYICSSSTPPGGGVHGMCGYHAASAALKQCF
jgi:phytoene dehydrogenase-like protein